MGTEHQPLVDRRHFLPEFGDSEPCAPLDVQRHGGEGCTGMPDLQRCQCVSSWHALVCSSLSSRALRLLFRLPGLGGKIHDILSEQLDEFYGICELTGTHWKVRRTIA